MSRPDVVAGTTGATMERWSAGIALTYVMFLPVVWATNMDIGVVFCRRDDFDAVGGYDETLKFAEDVKFLLALRRARPRSRQPAGARARRQGHRLDAQVRSVRRLALPLDPVEGIVVPASIDARAMTSRTSTGTSPGDRGSGCI